MIASSALSYSAGVQLHSTVTKKNETFDEFFYTMNIWYLLACYVGWLVIASIVTFALYGWDKRQAGLQRWRVPEKRLHWLSLVGGWPGAIIGQRLFRHKTQKLSFKLMFWVAVLIHVLLIAGVVYLGIDR
jgi:uncharacterized membrane protein YsdA (DUF1294 family)